jgi:MORN repeat
MKTKFYTIVGFVFVLAGFNSTVGFGQTRTFDLSKYPYCSDIGFVDQIEQEKEKMTQIGCVAQTSNSALGIRLSKVLDALEWPTASFTIHTNDGIRKCISMDEANVMRHIIIDEKYINALALSDLEKDIVFNFAIAHEVAHHFVGDLHTGYGNSNECENHLDELFADRKAGNAIGKLMDVDEAQIRIALGKYFRIKSDCFTHPSFEERILWVLGGWLESESNGWKSGELHQIGNQWYKRFNIDDRNVWIQTYDSQGLKQSGFSVFLNNAHNAFEGGFSFGNMLENKKNGINSSYYNGVARNTSSSRYFGNFVGGERSGFGEFYFVNGSRYVGNFELDHFEGFGVIVYYDGEIYLGEWENDQKTGFGIRCFPAEGQRIGTFVDNKFVQGSSDKFTRRKK